MDEYPDADWLIVACDLPNIDSGTLAYLLENRSSEKPFTAFKSSHDDLPEPLCAVYRSGSDAIVRSFVDGGIVCPRKILIRSDTLLLSQPDPAALDNINTPDDLVGSVLEANR
jgi:molybdopterin-guanine dinucleotide biosynthesis protein A